MSRRIVTALGACVLLSTAALRVWADTITFECDYKTYSDAEGLHRVEDRFLLTFLVDVDAGKAYVIGQLGSNEVSLIPNDKGFSLVEVTGTGNVMLTVISFQGPSVHSRGSMIRDTIVPSQYYGSCRAKP